MHNFFLVCFVSEVSVEFALAAPVNSAHHVAKMTHADVHSTGISEEAVVELGLVRFGVLGGVTNRHAVLLFSVATPHSVDGFLASQEVVSSILQHLHVANVHTDGEVFAVAVTVTKQTNFVRIRGNLLDVDAEFVLGALLLSPVDGVLNHLVEEVGLLNSSSRTKSTHIIYLIIINLIITIEEVICI